MGPSFWRAQADTRMRKVAGEHRRDLEILSLAQALTRRDKLARNERRSTYTCSLGPSSVLVVQPT